MIKYDINTEFASWYQEVVLKADLADYGPVKGTMIFKPYGYALWKRVQEVLGEMINKRLGAADVYFPSLIPLEFLEREKEHVEGFAPEVAVVTHAGGKKLSKPVVIRPTSETVMYDAFARWISSYRDLPLKVNQWVNIVRWEKRTVLFLRSTEFLWQEGHTVHATKEEAAEQVIEALDTYEEFLTKYMALPVVKGYKVETEKFAGALYTTTLEALLYTKKALQVATSHHLGQNFAKAFGIKFLSRHNKEEFAWQTSWGLSTRTLGGLIATHGDQAGLVLPPEMAPIKIVIVPIYKGKEEKLKVAEYISSIEKMLDGVGISYHTDWSENTPGWKFNQWELKGVPLRIEVGPSEVEGNQLRCVSRLNREVKVFKRSSGVYKALLKLLDEIQVSLYKKALDFLNEHTSEAKTEEEFAAALSKPGGFVKVFYKDSPKAAEYIKEKYKATPRVVPFDTYEQTGRDFITGEKGARLTWFAKAY